MVVVRCRRESSGGSSFKYLLQSVIVHHGSADGGHYTTYRRLSTVERGMVVEGGLGLLSEELNSWVHVSDDEVSPVSVDQVLDCEAYMLFYQALPTFAAAEGGGRHELASL